jgi:thiol-disulfide isomerase/thioredoxin
MKSSFLTIAVLGLSLTLTLAENAADIIRKFEGQKAEALDAYLKANPKAEDVDDALDELIAARETLEQNEAVLALLQQKYTGLKKGADMDPRAFFTTMGRLLDLLVQGGKRAEAESLIATAKRDVEGHPEEAKMKPYIDQMAGELNKPQEGSTMEIAFTGVNGEKANLADMKGKVVLVDFWATWCGPCVAELPNVLKAYEAYHAKGFEVIGISLDEDKGKLERFLKDKKMPWPQEFSGEGWGAPLAKKYGINSIPATFLIGKDGKIAASNLRGKALEAAVKKELGL